MNLKPGDKISYKVSFLEMDRSPNFDWPEKLPGENLILHSKNPSSRYFFDLYNAVGAEYEWTDKHAMPIKEINDFLSHSSVRMFTFLKDGWTAGFFILDYRDKVICDLAYFGLVPEAIGQGYGKYLLKYAIKESWKHSQMRLLTVNTNTLDHPNALRLYLNVGFKLTKTKTETRILTRSRDTNSNIN